MCKYIGAPLCVCPPTHLFPAHASCFFYTNAQVTHSLPILPCLPVSGQASSAITHHHYPSPLLITTTYCQTHFCHPLSNHHQNCCWTHCWTCHYPLSNPLLPIAKPSFACRGLNPCLYCHCHTCCHTCLLGGQNPAFTIANTIGTKFVVAACQVE